MPAMVVLGARNLGGAILDHFHASGWETAAVARSEETLDAVRQRGAYGFAADATDPAALSEVLQRARQELGGLDLVVNAVSAARRTEGEPFGGGPIAGASLQGFRGWAVAVAEQSFVFLSCGIRALRDAGGGGTLVQVTGGSSARAFPGRGPWAAGAFASRALVQAAAQEVREEGIHVALLAVNATIESPKTAPFTTDTPREALASQESVARTVAFLADQDVRGMTHEIVVTPAGDRWIP
jgi:NAD(P)-dependent dehydrogenase (short-subunit alcohol dehydrogenase family)